METDGSITADVLVIVIGREDFWSFKNFERMVS